MKINKVEKREGIFYVTKTPNFIERLFGMKEVIERYRWNNEVFMNFNDMKVFYRSDGKMVRHSDKMCEILNNYEHSF